MGDNEMKQNHVRMPSTIALALWMGFDGVYCADHGFPLIAPSQDVANSQCVQSCIHRNQMAAVGFEVIEQQCRQECRQENDLDAAVRLSQSTDRGEFVRGAKALSNIGGQAAVAPLIAALERDLRQRTGVWAWIIPALGASGSPEAVPILLKLLVLPDDDWLGRDMAAQALGDIGDRRALPALLDAAWRADTRQAAIEALAGFKDPQTLPVLLSALDPDEDPETIDAALQGLRQLGTTAIPALIAAFNDYGQEYPRTQRRLSLCRLLAASSDKRAVAELRKARQDPNPVIRHCATHQLRH